MSGNSFRYVLGVIVATIWGVSYTISIVNHSFRPPAEINPIMLIVVGYFFASADYEKRKKSAREEVERELESERLKERLKELERRDRKKAN